MPFLPAAAAPSCYLRMEQHSTLPNSVRYTALPRLVIYWQSIVQPEKRSVLTTPNTRYGAGWPCCPTSRRSMSTPVRPRFDGGSSCQGGNVEVLDVASGQNLAVIPMAGDQVTQIVVAPGGETVYVSHFPNFPCYGCDMRSSAHTQLPTQSDSVPSSALTAIDVATLQVGASYVPSGYSPQAVAIGPDGHRWLPPLL
jgi:hypothetical protein